MTHVYVITATWLGETAHKIGIHTGTKTKLKTRYGTYFGDFKVAYFEELNNAEKIEAKIKGYYSDFRLENKKGNKSEWLDINLERLIRKIEYFADKYPDKKNRDNNTINLVEKILKYSYGEYEITTFIDKNNKMWFAAKEFTRLCGYKDVRRPLRYLIDKNERVQIQDICSRQEITKIGIHPHSLYISEETIYKILLRSRMKDAKEIKLWLAKDVISTAKNRA